MENYLIVTDSASDITPEEAAAWDGALRVIPLSIAIGDEVFQDGVTLTHSQFYEKLVESDELPKTSMIPPLPFHEAFQEAVDAGRKVLAVTLSGKLSGTYGSAAQAAADFPGEVFVVDSLNATMGERIQVEYARELLEAGCSVEEAAAQLERTRGAVRTLGLLDTLEYLKKGGRISPATAVMGDLLSIKPVITVQDGEVAILGKARGSKNGSNFLIKAIDECGGVDFAKPFRLGYTGLSDATLQKYVRDSAALWEGHVDELPASMVGATIGTHVGPGAIAVSFYAGGEAEG